MLPVFLHDATGHAIECKGRGRVIGSAPGAIESGFRTDLLTWWDRAIVGDIRDGHVTPTPASSGICLRESSPVTPAERLTVASEQSSSLNASYPSPVFLARRPQRWLGLARMENRQEKESRTRQGCLVRFS